MYKTYLLPFLTIFLFNSAYSQVGIAVNATGAAPTAGTMLDVTSATNTSSSVGIRVNNSQFVVRGDGNIGIGTSSPSSTLHIKGNAGVLNIEGTDHAYIQWYPDADIRRAYVGFPSGLSANFTIANEIAGGRIDLSTTSGSVRISNLAGSGTKPVIVDNNGALSVASGGWTKVYETTLAANAQNIDISGLNLDTYKVFDIYFSAGSTAVGEVKMYFNGNYTDANYDCHHGHFYGTNQVGSAHRDYPEIGVFTGATSVFVQIKIMRGTDGRPRYIAHEVELCTATHGEHLYGGYFQTNTNVTSIRLRNVSGSFTPGTRVIIMGMY